MCIYQTGAIAAFENFVGICGYKDEWIAFRCAANTLKKGAGINFAKTIALFCSAMNTMTLSVC